MKNSPPNLNQQKSNPAKNSVVARFSSARDSAAQRRQLEGEISLEALKSQVDMEKLETIIRQAPDINASRVVSLHHRIEAGEYEIDPARVAEKLFAFETSIDVASGDETRDE